MRFKPSLLLPLLFGFSLLFAQSVYASPSAEALARLAVSEKSAEAGPAIAALRAMGPAGLRVMFEVYSDQLKRHALDVSASKEASPEWQRLSAALDAVSQQRDDYASGLYWYTDFEQAKRAAAETGKPILSLRLLGNLNEEFSCANSRFFRTVLYANREVSDVLRERFILHWKSVRPAPRVTIDFGDGRKLERTLTGNSIHYVLDPSGRPVDALPGLYGPRAFLRGLAQAEEVVKRLGGQNEMQQSAIFSRYHMGRINQTAADWSADVQKIGGRVPTQVLARVDARILNPGALEVAPLAASKAAIEVNLLKSITTDARELEAATDDKAWAMIAALHVDDARLDERSIALIRRHTPVTETSASAVAQTKTGGGDQLSRIVENLERNMALDTVRNEYVLHNRLHAWLVNEGRKMGVDDLNSKVYAELFLTPGTDPWLGLYSPDSYTALENGGIIK
ncbi:MAG TPA: hypothetical protein VGX92_00930 [Pyrinomonadaceae bacterium]|jgi:hypothetical protein|nr:hypothetical protein [Pyrinomonadaceae bacterium]